MRISCATTGQYFYWEIISACCVLLLLLRMQCKPRWQNDGLGRDALLARTPLAVFSSFLFFSSLCFLIAITESSFFTYVMNALLTQSCSPKDPEGGCARVVSGCRSASLRVVVWRWWALGFSSAFSSTREVLAFSIARFRSGERIVASAAVVAAYLSKQRKNERPQGRGRGLDLSCKKEPMNL